MAEGFLKSYEQLKVYSAGTHPAEKVHPKAVKVMKEIGIDLASYKPKLVYKFIQESFDYIITVCDNAKENCPVFIGDVKHRLHMRFEDPAEAKGTEMEILEVFRTVRDQIKKRMDEFYVEKVIG